MTEKKETTGGTVVTARSASSEQIHPHFTTSTNGNDNGNIIDQIQQLVQQAKLPPADCQIDDKMQRDRAHARELEHAFNGRYRWAEHRRQWMRWTGAVWQAVAEEVVARDATDTLLRIYSERLAETHDKDEIKALANNIKEVCVHSRITGALAFLKGAPGVITAASAWDADPWLLNVRNGTLDLHTCELRPHDPDDLLTKIANVEYDPNADARAWHAHIERCLASAEIRRQVQRDLGVALVGAVLEEALPIWYGTGANGKTTTERVIQRVLGDYARQAAPDLLVRSKHSRHPTEIADLAGARLVFSSEIDANRQLAEALVKSLTGGDIKKARFMHGNFFEFEQTFSIFLIANHKPVVAGTDEAIWRRIRLVPWQHRIPEAERRPLDEVVDELATPAVLNWLLAGLRDWQRERNWIADEVLAATQAYREEQDALGAFLKECCEFGPRYAVSVADLYNAYAAWCTAGGEEPLAKTQFGKLLRQRGITQRRAGHDATRRWVGLRLLKA